MQTEKLTERTQRGVRCRGSGEHEIAMAGVFELSTEQGLAPSAMIHYDAISISEKLLRLAKMRIEGDLVDVGRGNTDAKKRERKMVGCGDVIATRWLRAFCSESAFLLLASTAPP